VKYNIESCGAFIKNIFKNNKGTLEEKTMPLEK